MELLERCTARSIAALSSWSPQLNLGVENLLRVPPTTDHEDSLELSRPHHLLRLSTEFHPEYLRRAQHVYANLLVPYWAVLKKGSVEGKFDLRGAESLVRSTGAEFLLSGYDERIRNAIAHGEVVFRGAVTRYGPAVGGCEMIPYSFLEKFDELWRTSNALTVAILLFIARNRRLVMGNPDARLPPSITGLIADASIGRPSSLRVNGVVESEYRGTGRQLHVSVTTAFQSRIMTMADCARISLHLVEHSGDQYDRFLFEVDQGRQVPSLVIVDPRCLATLIAEQAPLDRLSEILIDTPLLFYDQSQLFLRARAWSLIFRSTFALAWDNLIAEWQRIGIWRAKRRCVIRKITNASASGTVRLRIYAVLKYPSDADDQSMIKAIVKDIISSVWNSWFDSRPDDLDRGWPRRGRPQYVWVHLYREDGTLRWLGKCGIRSGNLVAAAERVRGQRRQPLFVKAADETWNGIRFRYGQDPQLT
ncbi:MAG TPA: hypothetical protein VHS06_03090 [Chloroflexota bacterium]|nr:hypothetical protein [Chloroflexota bacterium]